MGKASKWIRNLLVGKKEEKNKKKDFPSNIISMESLAKTPNSISDKEKRRWSFRKPTTSRNDFILRSMKSFDSIVNSQKLAKALMNYSENEKVEVVKTIVPLELGPIRHGAATKIQASFRSYLARRALCALRALVKLQALVRGHLVRKQTTATIRCMHALISIQVRARVQRMHFSDKSQSFGQSRVGQRDLVLHKDSCNAMDETIISRKRGNSKTKCISRNRMEIKRMDNVLEHISPRLPNPEQELHIRTSSSLSNISTRHNNPGAKRNHFSGPLFEYDPLIPNYMTNTKSSRAKARSNSEPKQRPKKGVKQRSRRSSSNEQLDFDLDDLASSSSTDVMKSQHPWLTKLYKSSNGVAKESEYDNTSVTTDSSNTSRSIMAYEPPVILY